MLDPAIEEILFILSERQQKGAGYYRPLDPRRSQTIRAYYATLPELSLLEPGGELHRVLANRCGTLVCRGYTRVVIGDYGPYVEFAEEQACMEGFTRGSGGRKYNWLRTKDADQTKVYEQVGTVDYADYQVGMYYVSPSDVAPTRVVSVRSGEPYDVYVGRPGKGQPGYYGNPVRRGDGCFVCGEVHRTGGSTLPCFESYARQRMAVDGAYRQKVLALAGKTLACFCGDFTPAKPWYCHGQVLAHLAEEPTYRGGY